LKHFKDIEEKKIKWDSIISNKRGWLEVLIYNRITIEQIQKIIVEEQFLEYLDNLNQTNQEDIYDKTAKISYSSILNLAKLNNIKIESAKHV